MNLFAGGLDTPFSTAHQLIELDEFFDAIRAGTASYTFDGWIGGFADRRDYAYAAAEFSGNVKGPDGNDEAKFEIVVLTPVAPDERQNETGFVHRTVTGQIPVWATYVIINMQFYRSTASTTTVTSTACRSPVTTR